MKGLRKASPVPLAAHAADTLPWAARPRLEVPFALHAASLAPFLDATNFPAVATWAPLVFDDCIFNFVVERPRRSPFVPADLYDGQIVVLHQVPSREESWHDWLNMIVWQTFPRAKRALHTRQFQALQEALGEKPRTTLPNRRLPIQDRLTLLDEACFLAPVPASHDETVPLLREHLSERQILVPFGHGLLEFLVHHFDRAAKTESAPEEPRVPPKGDGRGFVVPIPLPDAALAGPPELLRRALDEALARRCAEDRVPMGRRLGWSFCASLLTNVVSNDTSAQK